MTRKTHIIFIFSVVLVLVSITTFAVVSIEVDRIGALLKERVQMVSNKYALEQKFIELNELIETTRADREALNTYVMTESKTISFLADIELIGTQQGVEFNTLSLNVAEMDTGPDLLSVQFSAVGSEVAVAKVLEILETLPYESTLTELSLTREEQSTLTVGVTLSIK